MPYGRAFAQVGAMALLAADCGSKSSSSVPTQAVLDACRQLHQAAGQAQAACYGGSAADWQAYWDQTLPCATYAKHVTDGTVTFDATVLSGCVQEIQAAPCEQASTCEWGRVFVGRVADGMPCGDYAVCGPQSGCFLNVCNPTCASQGVTLGESCLTQGCQPPLACSSGVCVAPAPQGGPCGGASALPCAPGLFCMPPGAGNAGTPGMCARYSTGPCSHDYECRSSQFCYQGTCTPRLGLGAPCADAQTGCGGFTTCDYSSASPTCIHTGLRGQTCGGVSIPSVCIDGSVCQNFICVAPGKVGDGCDATTCGLPLVCTGVCTQCPSPDAGQP